MTHSAVRQGIDDLVGQRAALRDNANRTRCRHIAGNDANLDPIRWREDTGAVRSNQTAFGMLLEIGRHLHHVHNWHGVADAHD
jgi:hypothetical protein